MKWGKGEGKREGGKEEGRERFRDTSWYLQVALPKVKSCPGEVTGRISVGSAELGSRGMEQRSLVQCQDNGQHQEYDKGICPFPFYSHYLAVSFLRRLFPQARIENQEGRLGECLSAGSKAGDSGLETRDWTLIQDHRQRQTRAQEHTQESSYRAKHGGDQAG